MANADLKMHIDPPAFNVPRSVRVEATYGAVPWACPESVTVEWVDQLPPDAAVAGVIGTLARLPELARPTDGAR